MNYLANLLTVSSLAAGFISIIFSLEGHFTFASWAIILAVVLDGLDGQLARRNPVSSEFGKELDSLADVVSFGIAPASLGYFFIYGGFDIIAVTVLFIYLLSSVWRLAKYNITAKGNATFHFTGLPTTAAGGMLSSFILVYKKYTYAPPQPRIFLMLVLLLAYLMVSGARYPNLDGIKKAFHSCAAFVAWPAAMVIFALLFSYLLSGKLLWELSILVIFAVYLIFSPFLFRKFV